MGWSNDYCIQAINDIKDNAELTPEAKRPLMQARLIWHRVDTHSASRMMEAMHVLHCVAGEMSGRDYYLTEERMEAAKWAMFIELFTGQLRIERGDKF
jgi:hypothetical protein